MGIKDSERKKKDRRAFVNRERINLFQQALLHVLSAVF